MPWSAWTPNPVCASSWEASVSDSTAIRVLSAMMGDTNVVEWAPSITVSNSSWTHVVATVFSPSSWKLVQPVYSASTGDMTVIAESTHRFALLPTDRARIQIERDKADVAKARAEALLQRHLREDQRRTLREHGWILVVAKSGTRYRIRRGRSHNVRKLDAQDREVLSLCAHPTMHVPEADCMLSQMLMLELAETKFLSMANTRVLF